MMMQCTCTFALFFCCPSVSASGPVPLQAHWFLLTRSLLDQNHLEVEFEFLCPFNFSTLKGGLISQSFCLRWLQSPQKCANHYSEHLLFGWIELRIVIWYIFGQLKNFKRLSHLYRFLNLT